MRVGATPFARISALPLIATALLSALNVVALRYNASLRDWNFNYNEG